jgi:uncharacterized protein (TIGR00369 family)
VDTQYQMEPVSRGKPRRVADPSSEETDRQMAERIRASFDRQQMMQTIGATLDTVAPGRAEISLPFRADLTQQHGYLHAGVVATIADSACGYAAYTLMPADGSVLTVEYKINLLAPARGDRFVARAAVIRPGRTLTVAEADVYACTGDSEVRTATMLATLIALPNRSDRPN